MFVTLIIIGGLAFHNTHASQLAQGILLIVSTLANNATMGPGCYPIVSETPSGRLRYKTIAIGRFVYNLVSIFQNSVTPRMLSSTAWNWGGKAGLFYAGTNLTCIIWCYFRLPETKDRTFGEIDLLFEYKIPARKFKTTKVDRETQPSINFFPLQLTLSTEFAHNYSEKLDEDHKSPVAHIDKIWGGISGF